MALREGLGTGADPRHGVHQAWITNFCPGAEHSCAKAVREQLFHAKGLCCVSSCVHTFHPAIWSDVSCVPWAQLERWCSLQGRLRVGWSWHLPGAAAILLERLSGVWVASFPLPELKEILLLSLGWACQGFRGELLALLHWCDLSLYLVPCMPGPDLLGASGLRDKSFGPSRTVFLKATGC